MRKLWSAVLLCAALLCGAVTTTWAADAATLTITPDRTEVTADGGDVQVKFTITVAPPQGRELGVFSFRLKPSGNMTLPNDFKVNGEKVITYAQNDLPYDVTTGKGIFRTYEYTPDSCFFAAVGSTEGNRMRDAAEILTVTATIPAGSSGAYTLDAEFVAAPDGSGVTYTPQVNSTPVTVRSAAGASTGAAAAPAASNLLVQELEEPLAGGTPDTQVTVLTGDPGVTCEAAVSWLCDGAEMATGVFEAGHVYTVRLHLTATAGTFAEDVRANAGYALTRISATELELSRTYYVEATYTQEMTPQEGQERQEFNETLGDFRETLEPAPDGDIVDVLRPETQSDSPALTAAAIAIGVLAAAAAICQLAIPGGLRRLFRGKR